MWQREATIVSQEVAEQVCSAAAPVPCTRHAEPTYHHILDSEIGPGYVICTGNAFPMAPVKNFEEAVDRMMATRKARPPITSAAKITRM